MATKTYEAMADVTQAIQMRVTVVASRKLVGLKGYVGPVEVVLAVDGIPLHSLGLAADLSPGQVEEARVALVAQLATEAAEHARLSEALAE